MSKLFQNLPKLIFVTCLAIVFSSGLFLLGALAYSKNLPPIPQLKRSYKILFVDGSLMRSARADHLQPSRGQGDGVTINAIPDDGALIALVGFFEEETQMRLIQRDGTVVKKWSLIYPEHFPDRDTRPCKANNPLASDVHGAHITPQGEAVFNYEYCGTVKLDQCGGVLWTLANRTHHSIVPAETGGYWLLGRQSLFVSGAPDIFPPFSAFQDGRNLKDDTLLRISEEGDVIEEVSIPTLMRASGLEAQLTANGEKFNLERAPRTELVHTNKVTELPAALADAYPLFEAGDLAISMRQLNLVMVVDPDTKKVKWHQTGPWIRQHDPEFRPDGRISIFNNNVYLTAYRNDHTILSTPFTTNIIVVDPVSRETEVVFGEKPGQEMLSVIRGQHEVLANDGILITEFDAGRVLEVNADREIVWEYVNRYDDEYVGEITNSMLYPAGYFDVDFKACES